MYRCKECGAEFNVKPDYCDCGNDEFDVVGVTTGQNIGTNKEFEKDCAENNEIKANPKTYAGMNTSNISSSKMSLDSNSENVGLVSPGKNNEDNIPKFQSATSAKTFTTSPKTIHATKVDLPSMILFCLCLFLSLYIIFFAWNPKEVVNGTQTKVENTTSTNIPSIGKIWDDTLPVQKFEEVKPPVPEPVAVKVFNLPQKKQDQLQVIPKTQTVKTPQKKVTVVPLKKTVQTTTKSAVKKNETPKQPPIVNTDDITKQKAKQERLQAEAEQLKKLQAEQAKKAAEAKVKKDAVAKQELKNYKANLRNTIGRKIDFTRVIGDGSCTVAFKIDPSGKLINRTFAKQSSNNTLNDAVYNAVMATPTFNPPPSAYKNETLNLNIKFYNGNFEISLP